MEAMKGRVDIAAYRRSVLAVTVYHEFNPWIPLNTFIIIWGMLARIVFQIAILDWPIDLTVMGLA